MRKVVLIGGSRTLYETQKIDEEIVHLTNKDKPTFLFIGLACNYSDAMYDTMKVIYKNLGCETMYLKKKNIINNPDLTKEKIKKADIIYIGGGDTNKLMHEINENALGPLLNAALERGCVLAGMSAGAISLSQKGLSDYLIMEGISNQYTFTDGLGLVDTIICPHGDDLERLKSLKELLRYNKDEVLVIDSGAAVVFIDDAISIVKNESSTHVKKVYYENDLWQEEEIN